MSRENYNFAKRISQAILQGEEKMLLEDSSILELPKGQGAGTSYQKKTYADMKAIEIIEKLQNERKKAVI